MVARRTVPTDRTCTHCGAREQDGAKFRQWRRTCYGCENGVRRVPRLAPAEERVPLTDATLTPVRYCLHQLGPCPSSDAQPDEARRWWAACARVARELGYHEQASEWQALAG